MIKYNSINIILFNASIFCIDQYKIGARSLLQKRLFPIHHFTLIRNGYILEILITNRGIISFYLHTFILSSVFTCYLEVEELFIYRPFNQSFQWNNLHNSFAIDHNYAFIFKVKTHLTITNLCWDYCRKSKFRFLAYFCKSILYLY